MYQILNEMMNSHIDGDFLFPHSDQPIRGKVINLSPEEIRIETTDARRIQYVTNPENIILIQRTS